MTTHDPRRFTRHTAFRWAAGAAAVPTVGGLGGVETVFVPERGTPVASPAGATPTAEPGT